MPVFKRSVLAFALTLLLVGAAFGALVWADARHADRLAAGVTVAGVDVGGLTREQAEQRLSGRVEEPALRAVRVHVAGRTVTLPAARAGVRVGTTAAVTRAWQAGRQGTLLRRGWRIVTGGAVTHDEPMPVTYSHAAVRAFVARLARRVRREPRDAELDLHLTAVRVTPDRAGRRLTGAGELRAEIGRVLRDPRKARTVTAQTTAVAAKVTAGGLFDAQPVAVTVSRSQTRVRVFRRGVLVKTYRVAVGQPAHQTPTGRFVVQWKKLNPDWVVPRSPWAGSLAGKTIPAGDPRNPLKGAFIAFDGAVGFHGTSELGSLGSWASHGCVRMNPRDAVDLYRRVNAGAPVLVA